MAEVRHSSDKDRDDLIQRGLNAGNNLKLALRCSMRLQAPVDLLRQVVLLRLYLTLSVMYTAVTFLQADRYIAAPFLALLSLSIVSFADLIINDWLPKDFYFITAYRYRHWIYILMALGITSICLVMAKQGDGAAIFPMLLDACVAVGIAVTDLLARYRK